MGVENVTDRKIIPHRRVRRGNVRGAHTAAHRLCPHLGHGGKRRYLHPTHDRARNCLGHHARHEITGLHGHSGSGSFIRISPSAHPQHDGSRVRTDRQSKIPQNIRSSGPNLGAHYPIIDGKCRYGRAINGTFHRRSHYSAIQTGSRRVTASASPAATIQK